jgi:hypothetical protein
MTPRIITIHLTTYQPSSNIVPSNRYVTCMPIIHPCHYICCMSFGVLAASNLDITTQACCMTEIVSQSAIVCISNLVYSQCRYCIKTTSIAPHHLYIYSVFLLTKIRCPSVFSFKLYRCGGELWTNWSPCCAHTNSNSWTSPSWLARWEPFNRVQPVTVEEYTIHS